MNQRLKNIPTSSILISRNISSTKLVAIMQAQKLSISLPKQQCDFIEEFKTQHHYKSRSDVIKKALELLQQMQLEAAYLEASQEVDEDFEITNLDGLDEDETW